MEKKTRLKSRTEERLSWALLKAPQVFRGSQEAARQYRVDFAGHQTGNGFQIFFFTFYPSNNWRFRF
jgi:hypothetical protein